MRISKERRINIRRLSAFDPFLIVSPPIFGFSIRGRASLAVFVAWVRFIRSVGRVPAVVYRIDVVLLSTTQVKIIKTIKI